MDASKNACLQQNSCLTKPSHLMCQCGCKFGFVEGTWQVKWESLWETLSEHGVSDHMLWVLQCMYYGQTRRIEHNSVDGNLFCIRGGVRQGCVLIESSIVCVCFGISVWMLVSES